MDHKFSKAFAVIKNWDSLPDDAIVSTKIVSLVLGIAERTVRYHPALDRVPLSRGRYGFSVRSVRKIARGQVEVVA